MSSSTLSAIPLAKRRHLAATLGLFAVLFTAVGLVAAAGATSGVVRVFAAVALAIAVLIALVAWGVLRSITIDQELRADQLLDAAIEEVMDTAGAHVSCGCGHAHDPDEMHVDQGSCQHDGSGTDCAHSCETCVLASLRPSPTRSRAARLAE